VLKIVFWYILTSALVDAAIVGIQVLNKIIRLIDLFMF